jgi:hypothetical protein
MHFTWAAFFLLCSVGSVTAQQTVTVPDVDLPYAVCGDMAALRTNLTGAPDPTPRSDAILRRLGVRCVGPTTAPRVRQRF